MESFIDKVRKNVKKELNKINTTEDIIEVLQQLDALDHSYNQKKISEADFLLQKNTHIQNFQTAINSIGIEKCFEESRMILNQYSESAFGFLVSKMYNKIAAKECTSGLTEAFQLLAEYTVTHKGWPALFSSLDKIIDQKIAAQGVQNSYQEDYIKYEFYKKGWLSVPSHQNQELVADTMFNLLLANKHLIELPKVSAGIDTTLLKNYLAEYHEKIRPIEAERAKAIISVLDLRGSNSIKSTQEDVSPPEPPKLQEEALVNSSLRSHEIPSDFKDVRSKAIEAIRSNNTAEFNKVVEKFFLNHKTDGQIPKLKAEIYRALESNDELLRAQISFYDIEKAVEILGSE